MFNISKFFEKFVRLQKNNQLTREIIISTIKDIAGAQIKEADLDLKEESVYIKSSPILRNQVFMWKEKIEEKLKEYKIFVKIR